MIDLMPLCRRLFETVAPGIRGYVLLLDASESHLLGSALSFFRRDADLAFRPLLERAGLWHGRGFCFPFNPFVLDHAVNAHGGGERIKRQMIEAAALHELCHWLDCDATATLDENATPSRSLPQWLAAGYAYRLLRDMGDVPGYSDSSPWLGHEFDFIRIGCHAFHRAWSAGLPLEWRWLQVAGQTYGLSGFWDYYHALRDELDALADIPLRNLTTVNPPASFWELWCEDTKHEQREVA